MVDYYERELIEKTLRNYMVRFLGFHTVSELLKMVTEVVDAKETKEKLR